MSFVLSAVRNIAETASAATGTLLAKIGSVGASIVADIVSLGALAGIAAITVATMLGLEAGPAAGMGSIFAGATTAILNVGELELVIAYSLPLW